MSVNLEEKAEQTDEEKAKIIFTGMTTSSLPLCKIPWIAPAAQDSTVMFEESKFYKWMHHDNRVEFSQLCRLVNEVLPFYHPKRSVQSRNNSANDIISQILQLGLQGVARAVQQEAGVDQLPAAADRTERARRWRRCDRQPVG